MSCMVWICRKCNKKYMYFVARCPVHSEVEKPELIAEFPGGKCGYCDEDLPMGISHVAMYSETGEYAGCVVAAD